MFVVDVCTEGEDRVVTGAASGIGLATTRRIIDAFPGEVMPARRRWVEHDYLRWTLAPDPADYVFT